MSMSVLHVECCINKQYFFWAMLNYAGNAGNAGDAGDGFMQDASYCSGQPTGRLEFRSGIVLDVFFVLFMFLWIYITDSLRWNIT